MLQAVSKPGDHKRQLQLLLRCKDNCTGSLQPLLALLGKAEAQPAEAQAAEAHSYDPAPDGIQAPDAVQFAQDEASAGSLELADGSSAGDAASGRGSDGDSSLQFNHAPL